MDHETASLLRAKVLNENDPVTAAAILGRMFSESPDVYDALHGRELAPGITIQNPGPDPSAMAEKWTRNTQNASADYVRGMQNPRRDPVQAAVRAAGKYKDRTMEAINEGRWEAGVRNQNYPEAVQIATSDGGAAYAAGARRRESKVQRVYGRLAPLLGAVSQAIQTMPQDSDSQREQRLLAARRAMINVGRQYRGQGAGR